MKVFKCLLAAVLAALLCSCRVTPYEIVQQQVQGVEQDTVITIILHEGECGFLEAAAEAYMSGHPQVKIQTKRLSDDADYNAKVLSESYSEDKPSAFAVDGERSLNLWKEDVVPLPFDWLKDAPAEIVAPVESGGNCRALPLSLTGYGIVYNAELLSSLEIDSSAINTLEGLQQVAAALNEKIAADEPGGKLVSAFCTAADFSPFVPVGEDRKTLRLSSLGTLRETVDLLPAPTEQNPAQMLAEGKAALWIGSTDILAEVRELNKETANALRIAPLSLDGQAASSLTVGCDYLAVSQFAGQAEQNAVLDFLNWLYTSPEGQEVLSSYGVISPYSNTSSSALQSSVYSYIRTSRAAVSGKGSFPAGWATGDFDSGIMRYRTGELGWDDSIREIEDKWNRKARD